MMAAMKFKPLVKLEGNYMTLLLTRALESESMCAAYREALKNVMRSKPSERVKVAKKALFGLPELRQRGRAMLKVVKAAVIAVNTLKKSDTEAFAKAVVSLDAVVSKFDLRGATVHKWLKEK